MKFILFLLLISNLLLASGNLEKINLYLKWRHGFQFAGYYAAQKNGYYKAVGLDVNIIENSKFDKHRLDKILKDKNAYGIETSKILLDKKNRNKIKILSVIFQHSPLIVASLKSSGIVTPQQFSNKKFLGLGLASEIKAMIVKEGGDLTSIKFVDNKGYNIKSLVNHEVDLISGYITTLPYELKNKNVEYNIINPITYGIDFYGDLIFTSKEEVENNPQRVEKFLFASLKGWHYAMNHKKEMIDYILKNYKVNKSYDALIYEANIMEKDIIMSNFIEVGHMNLDRWKHIEKILKELNLVENNFDVKNFIYSKKGASIWKNKYFIYLTYTLIIIIIITLISILFTIKLNKEVKIKIKEAIQKEEQFRAIFNNNFQFTGILDSEGRLILANKASLEVIDKKEKSVIGKYFWETPWFEHSKEEQNKIKNGFKEVKEKGFARFETTHKSHDGKLIFVDLSIKAVKNEEGKVNSYVVEGRDITNYKKMERRVSESQKMEAIGILAGGISHDFNNIISAIISNAELAKMNVNSNEILDELNEIINAGKRAKKLVSRIISFSKGVDEEKKNINLITLIESIIKLIRPTIKNKNINLEFKYKKNAPIYAVYTQIEQVIMNIIRNGLQAIDNKGKVEVVLDIVDIKEDLMLFNSVLPINKYVKVSITDTGSGISKENLSKIFNPYFSTKNKKDGTGLGLFVVQGIMNKHDAYIDVKSSLNHGTSFELYFPVASSNFDDIKTGIKIYSEFNDVSGKHVLFVDDEEMITTSISKILIKKGFIVDTFYSPLEAYIAFKNNPNYDIIITDQNMPDLTGVELVAKIREIDDKVPIILCSGYNSIVDASNISLFKINEYMDKPIMINDLLVNINHLITNNS